MDKNLSAFRKTKVTTQLYPSFQRITSGKADMAALIRFFASYPLKIRGAAEQPPRKFDEDYHAPPDSA
jgi:hypothetical protein